MKSKQSHLLLFTLLVTLLLISLTTAATVLELPLGFTATPDSSSPETLFQPLLSDPTSNFSLGFLKVNDSLLALALAVLHVTSSDPFWLANPTHLARWSHQTHLTFNGSLVLSDPTTNLLWSTHSNADRVVLQDNSNLVLQRLNQSNPTQPITAWQSFDVPTDTLVENQNFTSEMTLVSSNGRYSMKLGFDFIGLYARYSGQIYLRHKAMEAKTDIVENGSLTYLQINPDRYLGIFQTGNPKPADVQKFNTFETSVTGFLRLRLTPDGNLVGHFWDGSNWVLDYQAISQTCELPSACGSYGLCHVAGDKGCSCLDNLTDYTSGLCFPAKSDDFCGADGVTSRKDFWVLRRSGVELPYKELMWFETASSFEECERLCERNCSCWGAVFNGGSGFCYILDYPVETLVDVRDESKMGYFKVWEGAGMGKEEMNVGVGGAVGIGVMVLIMVVIIVWVWRREGVKKAVAYKEIGAASSRSIEMGTT